MNKLFYFLFEIKIYCDKDFELLFNYLIFFIKFFFTLFLFYLKNKFYFINIFNNNI